MVNFALKKPILSAGISLVFILWILQNFKIFFGELGNNSILYLTLIGSLWLIFQKNKRKNNLKNPVLSSITLADFQAKITSIKTLINTLAKETQELVNKEYNADGYRHFIERIKVIESEKIEEKNLEIVIISDNKVSPLILQKKLSDNFSRISFTIDNNLLGIIESNDFEQELENISLKYDLVLYILHEDLRESEKQIIQTLVKQNQKVIILFDTINYSMNEEKTLIFENIKNKLKEILIDNFIIQISSKHQVIKVKKYEDEINYQEWQETSEANYQNLLDILPEFISQNPEKLVLLKAYRNLLQLQSQVQNQLNSVRKEKALPLIEKYQIISATATFANPVSSLDLLATAAINTQMIVDLSAIYQHPLSLNQAKEISVSLAKLMIKLGIVEVSTQAITSILKTNAITFVAGGIIQGISTAYLTRICGLSLIEYYQSVDVNNQNNSVISLTKIKENLQLIFNKNKDSNFLNQFVEKVKFQFQS